MGGGVKNRVNLPTSFMDVSLVLLPNNYAVTVKTKAVCIFGSFKAAF